MDMFAWTRKQAVLYNGIIICCIGFESILVFLVVKVASKRYPHCMHCFNQKCLIFQEFSKWRGTCSSFSGLEIALCCLPVWPLYSVASLFCFPGGTITPKSSGQVQIVLMGTNCYLCKQRKKILQHQLSTNKNFNKTRFNWSFQIQMSKTTLWSVGCPETQ